MSEKTWTQDELDRIINEVQQEISNVEGLSEEEVAVRKAGIETKYGLPPGMLSRLAPSSGEEAEKQNVYPQHFEATSEELDRMTMAEYQRWRDLGAHMKRAVEEIQLDAEAEERSRAQAEENELIAAMSMPEYEAYRKAKALKADEEKEAAARSIQEEQKKKVEDLRHKNPEEMSMSEYAAWTELR